MKASALHLVPLLFLVLGSTPSQALPSDSPSISYQLGDEAAFEAGCLPPCMCPVLVRSGLKGTLVLDPIGFDGTFRHYLVRDIQWHFMNDQASVTVTGSGTYQVGGDQQQLIVDLSVGGDPPQRYDSGLTAGGSSFPSLRLPVALHGFFCHDSVYGVQATPTVTGVNAPTASTSPLRLGPNPFRGSAGIGFTLLASGPVDLRIHDLAGREVRALASGAVWAAGPHTLTWDGLGADGVRRPAGVYFVLLRTAGREERGTLVKLE